MIIRHLSVAVVLSPCLASAAVGQTVTCEKLNQAITAMDMSPDGRFVVGAADQDLDGFADGTYLLDLQTGIMTILPANANDACGVSDDGSVIVGDMPDPGDGVEVAGMWTRTTGWQSLGWLPDSLNCPSRSNGYEVSADGTVATGLSWDGCSGRAFVWTEPTGMVELEVLANGGCRGTAISADGTVVVGFAQGTYQRTPAMWDAVTTTGLLLGPDGPDAQGEVMGLSDDATVMLGTVWLGEPYLEAVKWTEGPAGWEVARIGEGSVTPGWAGYAMDIADNGTIVGFDGLMSSRRAWIKPAGQDDIVALSNYIVDHGGTVPTGLTLDVCTRITADGRTIVGHSFFQSAWKVTIGPGCPGDIDANGTVNVQDFLALLAAWGPNPGHPADIDGSGVVDVVDFLELLANWGDCP